MIEFGDWRIVRHDERNIETMHRHATTRGFASGETRWHKTGNYFQSVSAAVSFILDRELLGMAGDTETVRSLAEFLDEERRMRQEFRAWLAGIDSALDETV